MITTSIQLGEITFADVSYDGWSFWDLIDWWGNTSDKSEVVERPQAHGAFGVSRSLRESRAISFQATFIGSSQADTENAFDAIAAVGATGPVQMIVTTPAGRSARTVTVEKVTPANHRGRKYGRVAVDVIARDPRRYAVSEDVPWVTTEPPSPGAGLLWPAVWPLIWPAGGTSGRLTLVNRGMAPSAPMFRLDGGFDTALITTVETGARIGFDRPVPDGSVVALDTEAHRATIDDQSDVSRWLRWREWELIPPGASRSYQFDVTAPVGAPRLGGRVLSAWW